MPVENRFPKNRMRRSGRGGYSSHPYLFTLLSLSFMIFVVCLFVHDTPDINSFSV